MNLHSLRFVRFGQNFFLNPCSGVRNSFGTTRIAFKQSTWTSLRQNQSICDHAVCLAFELRPNTASKSTFQNGAEGVISNKARGLPPHPQNKGLNAVLERFGLPPGHFLRISSFLMPGHLPSSPSNPAVMLLLRRHREKSPHPSRFHKDGLFRSTNEEGRTRLCAQPGPAGWGPSALPAYPTLLRCFSLWLRPSTQCHFFCSAPAQALTCSGRVVRGGLNAHPSSLPYPGARAGFFVAAVQAFAP